MEKFKAFQLSRTELKAVVGGQQQYVCACESTNRAFLVDGNSPSNMAAGIDANCGPQEGANCYAIS